MVLVYAKVASAVPIGRVPNADVGATVSTAGVTVKVDVALSGAGILPIPAWLAVIIQLPIPT